MRVVVGITGASGAVYGWRLLAALRKGGCEVHAVVSENGWTVLKHECGVGRDAVAALVQRLYEPDDYGAAPASGSFRADAMVVAPCSMRTLAAVAAGLADNLLTRAADVAVKEGRRLVLVPRETPLSAIHLENMLKLARLGVRIVPASPGFYHNPQDVAALVDMMVGKVCDALGVEHELFKRWEGL
ncbi:UbiX family flavin prenyltransferase [Anaeroselena agilis]|uniref:Flavin prenyltransferase UbiX n=1 Tax=Anaeroselena agilis TaxID=3063788 RepID=A0ABU3NWS3_9FIRM|nr:UbiX family flavin prenyltransferase [Selenomonadales bacterium 4137-cl]